MACTPVARSCSLRSSAVAARSMAWALASASMMVASAATRVFVSSVARSDSTSRSARASSTMRLSSSFLISVRLAVSICARRARRSACALLSARVAFDCATIWRRSFSETCASVSMRAIATRVSRSRSLTPISPLFFASATSTCAS
eukprot:Amastigsp_a677091_7.p4 type:complete len:146 gc:universal Amastigsp_a677091_7:1145-708(-)